MQHSAHPERQTSFEKALASWGLLQGRIEPGKPWQNGFIERSNRTDNQECFNTRRFVDSEERRYYHRLYESYYNDQRPHQGLGGRTPRQVYLDEYHTHAFCRMLV